MQVYPDPKAARMEFCNSLVKSLYEANNSGDFKIYLCDQQKFRWEVKVATEKFQSQIEYFRSDASGIPRLRKRPKQPKKKDKQTCESLVTKLRRSCQMAQHWEKNCRIGEAIGNQMKK
jgi:hypothetical protein